MKKLSIAVLAVFAGVLCFGDVTFELRFPQKELKPQGKSTVAFKKFSCGPENFVPGPDGGFAFQLSDKNEQAKQHPGYNAVANVPFAKGSFEVCCKVSKRKPGTAVRLIHVYSPAKKTKDLLIYYCFINAGGDMMFMIQVKKEQFKLRIPKREFDAGKFNTFKLTWNAEKMACYLNGTLIEDRPLPPEFAAVAAQERTWSNLEVLPVFPHLRDAWENRIAVASLIFRDDDK